MHYHFLRALLAWSPIGLFYIYQYVLQSVLSVIRADIQTHFDANSEQFAILTAAFLYAYATIQIPAGMAFDKYGPRRILTLAVLCCSFGCYLFGHTDSYFLAVVARAILGASSSFAFLGSLCVVAMLFEPKYYAVMAGLTMFVGTLGAGLAQNEIAGWIGLLGSWHRLFEIFSYIGVGIAALVFIFIPERSLQNERVNRSTISLSKQLWHVLLNPYVWVVGLYGSFVYMPSIALGETWGYGFLIEGYKMLPDHAYQVVPKIFFGLAIGGPVFGYLESAFWTPFLIIVSNACIVLLLLIITTPSIALGLSMTSWSMIFFLIGFMGCSCVYAYTRIKETHPSEIIGTVTGVVHGINAVLWAASQQLMGRTLDNRLLSQNRALLSLEDYLVAMDVLVYSLIACLPLALIMAFIKPKKAHLVIQAITDSDQKSTHS